MPATVAPSPASPLGLLAPIRLVDAPARPSAVVAPAPRRAVTLAALLLIVVGAVALRIGLTGRSLWFDELITLQKSSQTLPALLNGLADDVHPPLYYVLLHGWMQLFGDAPIAARGLSVAWSAVTIGAIWAWSREAFPLTSGLPAAALAAFAPFSVWYATEARMYAQLLALTALAGWLAWRTLARGPRPLPVAGLACVLAAMALTHYFASLFIGALGLVAVVLWVTSRPLRPGAAWVAASCTAAMGTLLPWLAFVAEHRSAASPSPTVYPAPDIFSVLIAGLEMVVGFQGAGALGLLAAGWPLLGLLALGMLPVMGRVPWRVAGLLVVMALPVTVLTLVSTFGPRSVFDPRFLAVCVPPLYLLLGRLADTGGSRRSRLATAGGVVAALIVLAVVQNASSANPKLYDFAGAVTAINAGAAPGDGVMMLPDFEAAGLAGSPVFAYYRPRPGIRVADTSQVGQVDARATRRELEGAWSRLGRSRPARVFVIDAFAKNPKAAPAAVAARAFLRERARPIRQIALPQMTVRVMAPKWGAR